MFIQNIGLGILIVCGVLLLAFCVVLLMTLVAYVMSDARQTWFELTYRQRRHRLQMIAATVMMGVTIGGLRYMLLDDDVPIENTIEAKVVWVGEDLPGEHTTNRGLKIAMNGEVLQTTPRACRMSVLDADKVQPGDVVELEIAHGKYTGRQFIKNSRLKR